MSKLYEFNRRGNDYNPVQLLPVNKFHKGIAAALRTPDFNDLGHQVFDYRRYVAHAGRQVDQSLVDIASNAFELSPRVIDDVDPLYRANGEVLGALAGRVYKVVEELFFIANRKLIEANAQAGAISFTNPDLSRVDVTRPFSVQIQAHVWPITIVAQARTRSGQQQKLQEIVR